MSRHVLAAANSHTDEERGINEYSTAPQKLFVGDARGVIGEPDRPSRKRQSDRHIQSKITRTPKPRASHKEIHKLNVTLQLAILTPLRKQMQATFSVKPRPPAGHSPLPR